MKRLFLSVAVVGCGGGDQSWSYDGVKAVDLAVSSGEIEVLTSDDGQTHVEWSGGGVGDNARPDVWLDGNGTLVVDAAGGILGGGELSVWVPAQVGVHAHAARGEVSVILANPSDVHGCVGAGEVSVAVPAGLYFIDAAVGAGSIDSDLVHDPEAEWTLSACAGAGEVSFTTYRDATE